MKIRNILENTSLKAIDLMTSGGYLQCGKDEFERILNGGMVTVHAGFSDSNMDMPADLFLDMEVTKYREENGIAYGMCN